MRFGGFEGCGCVARRGSLPRRASFIAASTDAASIPRIARSRRDRSSARREQSGFAAAASRTAHAIALRYRSSGCLPPRRRQLSPSASLGLRLHLAPAVSRAVPATARSPAIRRSLRARIRMRYSNRSSLIPLVRASHHEALQRPPRARRPALRATVQAGRCRSATSADARDSREMSPASRAPASCASVRRHPRLSAFRRTAHRESCRSRIVVAPETLRTLAQNRSSPGVRFHLAATAPRRSRQIRPTARSANAT